MGGPGVASVGVPPDSAEHAGRVAVVGGSGVRTPAGAASSSGTAGSRHPAATTRRATSPPVDGTRTRTSQRFKARFWVTVSPDPTVTGLSGVFRCEFHTASW